MTVGGKTGTANSDNKRNPYAWFISFAPTIRTWPWRVFVEDAQMPNTDVAGGRAGGPDRQSRDRGPVDDADHLVSATMVRDRRKGDALMVDEPRVLGGRYELGSLLGRGGMAEVYRGRDTRLGRRWR